MNCKSKVAAIALAAFCATALVPCVALAIEVGCGYVINRQCPGCSEEGNPENTTCLCGVDGEACNCVKEGDGGGIQTGEIITCYTGPFDWALSEHGVNVSTGDGALCLRAQRCMKDPGGQTNCGTYSQGACSDIVEGGCAWRTFSTSYSLTFTGTGKC